ncbi:hypothetical protein [Variovorax boronicumulans]|uniref:hypothetical protein n=1 Tax=Variovorax boronicumulans TaxID=436515 RepID=UPI003395693B
MTGNDLAQGRLVRLFDIGIGVPGDCACRPVYPEAGSEDPRVLAFRAWMLEAARQPA